MSLCIVLPKKRYGLKKILQELNGQTLVDWLQHGQEMFSVDISLPKFKVASNYGDLKTVLKALGVEDAFGDADFSGMTNSVRKLHISKIIHKVVIEASPTLIKPHLIFCYGT
jgi:serpin B